MGTVTDMGGRDGMDRGAHDRALHSVEESLEQLVNSLRVRWKDLARQVHPDLPPIGFRIVAALYSGGPQRSKDLAERLGSDKSVLSRQLSQLEKLGLVERHGDPDDGRVALMALTDTTADRMREISTAETSARYQALTTWPTERLQEFATMLREFNHADGVD